MELELHKLELELHKMELDLHKMELELHKRHYSDDQYKIEYCTLVDDHVVMTCLDNNLQRELFTLQNIEKILKCKYQ